LAAAVNDVAGWIILALITAIVHSAFNPIKVVLIVCEVLGYVAVMLVVVRPLVSKWALAQVRKNRASFL